VGALTHYALGYLLGSSLWVWRPTLRVEVRGKENFQWPCVLAFWHGRLLGVLMNSLGAGAVSMASQSRDGALAAGALVAAGIRVTRGSGSRGGGDALRAMRAAIAAGAPFAGLTVDGPRGPWREVQPGVVLLARWLKFPVVPATFSCDRARVLRSWDRMVVPRPFSRMVVEYGTPIPADELGGDLPGVAAAVRDRLEALTAALDRNVAGRELWPPR
jgi:lysophospholipid acyltransferase (LPLAT)-like uncharacterized protein